MKIAILGSGGREHAIAWKLSQDLHPDNIFVLNGNGGINNSISIDYNDFEAVKAFCQKENIELIIVGPEVPLANGIIDFFAANTPNIKVFGPDKNAAQLESSKKYAKRFMQKYGVATAQSFDFEEVTSVVFETIRQMNGKLVIKYDGLAAGKGVFVCHSIEEAENSLKELVAKYGKKFNFLIEELLIGQEISIIGITDSKSIQLFAPSQDHKQLLEGDRGPNTGGMGAYCPVPFVDKKLMQTINKLIIFPTLKGLQSEAYNYKGIIYFGLMITEDGPKVLEYNARFGDPETEVILPKLKSSLLDLMLATFDDSLHDFQLEFNDGYFIDVVLVSGGYPKAYEKGQIISGLEQMASDTLVFHAGTKVADNQLVTNGGRVLNIVVKGDDLEDAIEKVYQECEKVSFNKQFYRKDIGQRKFNLVE